MCKRGDFCARWPASVLDESEASKCIIPFDLKPYQIVSLYEMYEFQAGDFFGVINRLISIRRDLEKREDQTLTSDEQSHMHTHLDRVESVCAMYDIDVTYYSERARGKIDDPSRFTFTVASAIDAVRHCIMEKLRDRKFMYISRADVDYLGSTDLFGIEVQHANFPEADEDIVAAGNSVACGLYTASVFHSMRVAELGLRRIAIKLQVKLKDKGQYHPIEYGTWDKVITACKNKITKIRQRPIGPKRQEQLEFYSDAGDHCLFMKDIWRNNISHTRKPYNRPEALAVLERVKDFMKFLVRNDV